MFVFFPSSEAQSGITQQSWQSAFFQVGMDSNWHGLFITSDSLLALFPRHLVPLCLCPY